MRIIVCGGRGFSDRVKVFAELDRVHAHKPITMIIEGGQTGADKLAGEWADDRGIDHITCHANWKAHGRSAGPRRNDVMLNLGAEGVVAFPGGSGTASMISKARSSGVPVMEVK